MRDAGCAIVAAAAREASAVRHALQSHARRRLAAGSAWEGSIAAGQGMPRRVWLVQAGIGPARAEAAARAALAAFRPGAILIFGFAGALRPGPAPGTLVLAERVSQAVGEGWTADAGLLAAAAEAAAAAGIPTARGPLVTVEVPAGTVAAKAALAAATGGLAVDMEAAAVAAVAAGAGLPWLAAKVVLDEAEEPLHPGLMDLVRPDGSPRPLRAALLAARDGELRAALRWAAARSRAAARVLTAFCRAFLPRLDP